MLGQNVTMDNPGFNQTDETLTSTYSVISREIIAKKEKTARTDNITLHCTTQPHRSTEPSKSDFKSVYTKFRSAVSAIEIEFVTFIITFALGIAKVSATSLILDKSCSVYFGHSIEICGNLQNFSTIKLSVEKVAANYQLSRTLIQNVPAAMITIFFMPWSDIYSRKLPLQLAMAGASIDAFAGALCSYNYYWGVEYYFIGTVLMGFTGGSILKTAILYSLISDLSTVDKRTTKFSFFEISTGLGLSVSVISGGWIYETIGYTAVFSVSATSLVFAIFWFTFLVPESRGIGNTDNWQTKFRSLFSFKMLVVGIQAVSKKLPNNGRQVLVMEIISICIIHTSLLAIFDIGYLYVHHQFDWSNSHYSEFLTIYLGLMFMVTFLLRPLLQRFDMSDGQIALLGCASVMIKYFLMGLAWNTITLHIANSLGIFILLGTCGFRSHVSKLVSKDDLGKIFSFVSIAEGVSPMIGSVFLTQIFNLFLDSYAGAPFLLLWLLLLLPLSVAVWTSNMCSIILKLCTGSKDEPI